MKTKPRYIAIVVFVLLFGCSPSEDAKMKPKSGMIVAELKDASQFIDMHPLFSRAFEFLQRPDLAELEPARYPIQDDTLFCIVDKTKGRTRDEASLEAHRKYIDIQYVISGVDEMGWKPTKECSQVKSSYDPEKDIEFFLDEPSQWTKVPAGFFAIFFPQDAHAPLVSDAEIHKVVVKVAVK